MNCYFGAYPLPEQNDLGKNYLVLFHIPELGIRFKAPFDAVDTDHSDLASLLALLEFIDLNPKYFAKQDFTIYGTNKRIIAQLNGMASVDFKLADLLKRAVTYRAKYHYSLQWVPPTDNAVFMTIPGQ